MAFSITGNAQAVNARMLLTSVNRGNNQAYQEVYTSATGNYTFIGVAPGTYKLTADLSQCTTAPYNTGYSYRQQVNVTVVANNLSNINMTPVLLSAANPGPNAS